LKERWPIKVVPEGSRGPKELKGGREKSEVSYERTKEGMGRNEEEQKVLQKVMGKKKWDKLRR